uniref:Uncharacterized protein n=1 Tax=Nelumbo nucifera TaxID=4432 RepID=A0A822YFE8_NELNU|nr:TPA_asm: hypothetical protein HUJ06_031153 [Nelumbo nucifera]
MSLRNETTRNFTFAGEEEDNNLPLLSEI